MLKKALIYIEKNEVSIRQVLFLRNLVQMMKHYANWFKNVKVVIIKDTKLMKNVKVMKRF